ncbi:MAG: acetyl-CoA carboxylase biotin carboxyl carrier protein subunit [Promethearchaeota archaeon]|jgi:acetyl/propionyl-CoA carboxylase alpha subunit
MQKRVKFRGREYIITPLDDGKLQVGHHIYSPIVIRETEFLYRCTFEDCQFNLELIDGKLFLEGEEIDIEIKPYLKSVDNGLKNQVDKKIIVKAPIPGKILQILVKENERVEKDQLILILEAMKMKNRILSPIKGIITQIYVTIEESVRQDQQLIKIEN